MLKREIDLMRHLEHPNIVQYLGSEAVIKENKGLVLYIMESWVAGGSLSELIHKFGSFEEAVVKVYVKQILAGLDYLHSQVNRQPFYPHTPDDI